jgi:2-haloacid dehalogenase
MTKPEVLFFDVLGTVVDWRGSIMREAASFLHQHGVNDIEPGAFADSWVGRYDQSVEAVRSGQRSFVSLDVLNMENLLETLKEFGLRPSALPSADLENLNLAWHRLDPWPDSVEGITRMKDHFIVAPLSDGGTRMMLNLAKRSGLPWDTVLGADIARAYKPSQHVYLHACDLLGVTPDRAMLVAAHDYDLDAARRCGLKTAYVHRAHGNDPSKPAATGDAAEWNHRAGDLMQLADRLNGSVFQTSSAP